MSVSGAGRGARQVSSLCRALLYTVRIVVVGNRPPGARGDPRPARPTRPRPPPRTPAPTEREVPRRDPVPGVPSLATPDPRTGRRREEPQPVRNITASAHLSNMRPSHGAMGLRWRMAMRCYVIGYSVRLERALRGPLESSSHGGGRLLPRARVCPGSP